MREINILFIVKVIFLLITIVGIQFYFYKILNKSIHSVLPSISAKALKIFRRFLIFFANLYLLISLSALALHLIFGNGSFLRPVNEYFDWLVVYPFWIIFIIIMQSSIILIPINIGFIVFSKLKLRLKTTPKMFYQIAFYITIFFSLFIPIKSIIDYNAVTISTTSHKISNLPMNLKGYRIALIADIQADQYNLAERLEQYLDKVNSLTPDLILIAGDVITESPNYIELAATSLGKLKAKDGVYACVGDHDNWAYRSDMKRSLQEVKEKLSQHNVPMLDNANLVIKKDSSKILISFVTNNYVNKVNKETLDSLAFQVDSTNAQIFLVHQPREHLMKFASEKGYDLYLAGHTHGGQVVLFFPFYNISASMLETPFVKGEFHLGEMLIYINRGLGMSGAPIRYNSSPEITLITLE